MASGASELVRLPATELVRRYRIRELSPIEVAEETLAHIDRNDGQINAFVTVTADRALADARAAEAAYLAGTAGPISGVPYTLKDLVVTRGIPTGRGSLVFAIESPAFDAPVADRLRAAGGVLLGKTTTPELGWKGDSGNPRNGPCHNPWRLGRTAGGSSGGSAAAAAACFGPLHQGSDGAGSIRIPAAFCGMVGIKPTFGSIAQYPASAVSSLSHLGPITRTVADCQLMLRVMAGADPRDRDSVDPVWRPVSPSPRIAYSPDLGFAQVDPAVAEVVAAGVGTLRDAGFDVLDVDLVLDDPAPIVDAIWTTGMAAALASVPVEQRALLDPGLVAVAERGLLVSGADLALAQQRRGAWLDALRTALDGFDLLVCPTLPITAFAAGEDYPGHLEGLPRPLGWTSFTYPFNVTGQPAATVPCGFVDGLPVGLQIVGGRFDDGLVLSVAAAFERARGGFALPPDPG
jgi:aspartyl-tRNA(Asn)/glutamyl-tRNA(Gln) amidotransferase subunit A